MSTTAAAPPTPSLLERAKLLLARVPLPGGWTRVGGPDVFVSYSRADGIEYAMAIAARLRGQGIEAFVDVYGTRPGLEIPPEVMAQLLAARVLLVVGSERASTSKGVAKEIAEFRTTRGQMILVGPRDRILGDKWFPDLGGMPILDDVVAGNEEPAPEVVGAVRNAVGVVTLKWRLAATGAFLAGVFGVMSLIAIILVVVSLFAVGVTMVSLNKASSALTIAAQEERRRAEAELSAKDAGERAAEANRVAAIAVETAEEAKTRAAGAEDSKRIADNDREAAVAAKDQARRDAAKASAAADAARHDADLARLDVAAAETRVANADAEVKAAEQQVKNLEIRANGLNRTIADATASADSLNGELDLRDEDKLSDCLANPPASEAELEEILKAVGAPGRGKGALTCALTVARTSRGAAKAPIVGAILNDAIVSFDERHPLPKAVSDDEQVRLSPDGRWTATMGARRATVTDNRDPAHAYLLGEDKVALTAFSFAPDGSTVAAGFADGTVEVRGLDRSTTASIPTSGLVRAIDVTNTGMSVIVATSAGTIAYVAQTPGGSWTAGANFPPAKAVQLDPTGRWFVGVTDVQGAAGIFVADLSTGEHRIVDGLRLAAGVSESASLSLESRGARFEGNRVVLVGANGPAVVDLAKARLIRQPTPGAGTVVAASLVDDRAVSIRSEAGDLRFVDESDSTAAPRRSLRGEGDAELVHGQITEPGYSLGVFSNGSVRLWSVPLGVDVARIHPRMQIRDASLTEGGTLTLRSEGGAVDLWRPRLPTVSIEGAMGGPERGVVPTDTDTVAVSGDGQKLLRRGVGGAPEVVDVATHDIVSTRIFAQQLAQPSAAWAGGLTADGLGVWVREPSAYDPRVNEVHYRSIAPGAGQGRTAGIPAGAEVLPWPEGRGIVYPRSGDGLLASADLTTDGTRTGLGPDDCKDRELVAGGGKLLAICGGEVRELEPATLTTKPVAMPACAGGCVGASVSQNGEAVAAWDVQNQVKVRRSDGTELSIRSRGRPIHTVVVSDDVTVAALVHDQGAITLLDIREDALLVRIRGADVSRPQSAAFSLDGRNFLIELATPLGRVVQVYEVPTLTDTSVDSGVRGACERLLMYPDLAAPVAAFCRSDGAGPLALAAPLTAP